MNLAQLKNKTILFLGKPRAFSYDEFVSQIELHSITLLKELQEDVKYILEGRMMNPYEQNLSDELYALKKYEFIDIDTFEKLLVDEIQSDTLLMSLKLSNDKERLKSFLQNSMISEELFFKLLKMYSWKGEDFFENDDNRDVSAALISRFYKNIERNHNVQYATTGIFHLVEQTDNAKLLEAITLLEPLTFHPKLQKALAMHYAAPKSVLKIFLKKGNADVKEALAYNPNLDNMLIKELLKEKYLAAVLAKNVKLNDALFELLMPYKEYLAQNETLTKEMQTQLLKQEDKNIYLLLAENRGVDKDIILELLKEGESVVNAALYQNSATPKEILLEAYKESKNYKDLAKNPAMPSKLLEEMYSGADEAVLDALARNENTPVAILYQLQLDSRFERAVKTNAAFGAHIQSENIGWLV